MPSSLPTENALGKAVNEFGVGTYDSDNGITSRGEDDEDPKSENSPHGDALPGTHGTDPFGPDRLLSYPQSFSSNRRVITQDGRVITAVAYSTELVNQLRDSSCLLPGDQDAETTHRHPKTDNIDSVIPTVAETAELPDDHENPSSRSDYYDHMKMGYSGPDFSSRISYALDMLDNIHVAADNVYDYLISLNLKQLQKTNKRDKSEDSREFYERLQEQSKQGPIFNSETLDIIKNYRVKIDKNTAKWLATLIENGLKPPTNDELSYVFDWIRDQEPDLEKLGFEEAKELSDEWHEGFKFTNQTGKYKTKNVDHDFGDGYTMVLVPVEDLDVEGSLMQHCVGSYKDQVESGTKIYSLRDSNNKPHVTIEVRSGKIQQVQGKQNAEPIKKYHPYVWEWIEKRGLQSIEIIRFAPPEVLAHLADNKNPMVRRHVAQNHNTSPEILTRLANDLDLGVRRLVSDNHNTPSEALSRLTDDDDIAVHQCVAWNPNTPPEALSRLANDPSNLTRQGVANNHNTPPEVLAHLADDFYDGIRRYVASNPNTPPETLAKLSGDLVDHVRWNVAKNSNTSPETLTKLSGDTDESVRYYVDKNPNTPPEALARLDNDHSVDVRQNAATTISSYMKMGYSGDEWADEDSGSYSSEESDSLPGVTKNEVTMDNFLNSLGNFWSGHETEDISGPSGHPSEDFLENVDYDRSDLQDGGSIVVSTDYLAFSDRISSVLDILDNIHLANSLDYLVDLNLKKLQKTNKRDKSEDARSYYERLQELAKSGPLFSAETIQIIEDYKIKEKNTAKWLATKIENGLEPPESEELTNISDWIRDQEPDLEKLDFEEAKELSDEWHESFVESDESVSYKTNDVDYDFGDGYTMVLVPVEDLDAEGTLMGHCVGSYKDQVENGTKIFSLRDSDNKPHITIELTDDGEIEQVKGKKNSEPSKKYRLYVWKWIEKNGLQSGRGISYAPPEFFDGLSNNSNIRVRKEISGNENAPPEVLTKLSNDENNPVRQNIAKNPNTPPEVLIKLSNDVDYVVRLFLLKNRNVPVEVLVILSDDENISIRFEIAKNRNTPPEVLTKLSDDANYGVRSYVSNNSSAPPEALVKLANDEDSRIRFSLSKNSKLPADTLDKLANDRDYTVRSGVANNPMTSSETLDKLSDDEHWGVRSYVVRNPNVNLKILTKLHDDKFYTVRQGISYNHRTPPETLAKLVNDERWEVRDGAISNPNMSQDILKKMAKKDGKIFKYLAKSPKTSPEILSELASYETGQRVLVIENPNTPPEVLIELANNNNGNNHWDNDIRSSIAYVKHAPPEVLIKLSDDESNRVREGVAGNPNTPVEILNKLANDESYAVRQSLAKNPNTSQKILTKLSEDENDIVRTNVAGNPSTSQEVLTKLVNDSFWYAREAAKKRLNLATTFSDRISSALDLLSNIHLVS